jgi:hypothetical protein
MERRVINPWTWQDAFGFVQANEVSGAKRTVICSGQTSVDASGRLSIRATWRRRSARR